MYDILFFSCLDCDDIYYIIQRCWQVIISTIFLVCGLCNFTGKLRYAKTATVKAPLYLTPELQHTRKERKKERQELFKQLISYPPISWFVSVPWVQLAWECPYIYSSIHILHCQSSRSQSQCAAQRKDLVKTQAILTLSWRHTWTFQDHF